MAAPTLSWSNLFVADLETLPAFYMGVFGFEEIPEMSNPYFRGLATGRTAIGFMSPAVYGVLQLDEFAGSDGVRSLLNFEVESTDEVDRLVGVAAEHGAKLVKDAAMTSYGWYQAVLLDPEGNVFRINKVVDGPSF
jgi:predicted enzyme related to lactoylglutathione lyase